MQAKKAELDSDACAEAARTCASFNFRKASRAVTGFFDQMPEPTSLRSTQFVVLVAIHLHEPITLPSLARELTEATLPFWKEAQRRFTTQFGKGNWETMLSLLPDAVSAARTS
jgi:hypothetical protein